MPEQDLGKIIEEAAESPKSAEIDGQKAESRPLPELIEADRYLASKKAMSGKGCGIKITKMSSSGA